MTAAVYLALLGLIFFGIALGAAELLMFRHFNGALVAAVDKRVSNLPVYLRLGGPTHAVESKSDSLGRYRFLLTEGEYSTAEEVQAGTQSLVLTGDDRCDPSARVCYVPPIILE